MEKTTPQEILQPSTRPWRPGRGRTPVAVLMSGGVDSGVAALLLREQGMEVLGITLRIPGADLEAHPKPCCGVWASFVCRQLDIPHYFLDLRQAFTREVIGHFRREYACGRTPSPCIDCNTRIKFGHAWELVERHFAIRHLATGHYARVTRIRGRARLLRASCKEKDQSYFIYGVPRRRLDDLLLPLGTMDKSRTRALARARGLPVAHRPESMELCFAGEGNYRLALGGVASGPGEIRSLDGEVLGRHRGIEHYTVGQRHGLGLSLPEPVYVLRILPRENALLVGTREQAYTRRVRSSRLHLLQPERLRPGATLRGKIRSGAPPLPCRVLRCRQDGPPAAERAGVEVEFLQPVFAPAPGQHLVLYDAEDAVVGGGVIT